MVNGTWTLVPEQSQNIPSAFVGTRISANSDWVLSTVPEPQEYGLAFSAGLASFVLLLRRRGFRSVTRLCLQR
jgi:hypothetical protein